MNWSRRGLEGVKNSTNSSEQDVLTLLKLVILTENLEDCSRVSYSSQVWNGGGGDY